MLQICFFTLFTFFLSSKNGRFFKHACHANPVADKNGQDQAKHINHDTHQDFLF